MSNELGRLMTELADAVFYRDIEKIERDRKAIEAHCTAVVVSEREACAVACESERVAVADADDETYNLAITHAAIAIRSRGV